jgi:WD40 repeat protein
MSPLIMEPSFGEVSGFAIQQHGHRDMVQAGSFNNYGNRFALGSADGRIKVYDRRRDGSWVLCDTWAAHTAEILEVWILEQESFILILIIPADPLAAIYYTPKSCSLDIYRWEVQTLG